MTDLRQAAMLALDALEDERYVTKYTHIVEAVTLLRKALEQPEQEPTCPECKAAVLYECVACSSNNYPHKPEQEPVAWICYGAPGKRDIDFEESDINELPIGTHLYTTPPAAQPEQRKPLTEPRIHKLWRGLAQGEGIEEFARAIEAAHGIKERNT